MLKTQLHNVLLYHGVEFMYVLILLSHILCYYASIRRNGRLLFKHIGPSVHPPL